MQMSIKEYQIKQMKRTRL